MKRDYLFLKPRPIAGLPILWLCLWCLVLLLQGCTTQPQVAKDNLITGQVLWSSEPVAGSTVELKAGDDYDNSPVITQTTSGRDGSFALENVPSGQYVLYATAPDNTYMGWTGRSVKVPEQTQNRELQLYLKKRLQLLEPADRSTLDTLTPTFRWGAFPGAVSYHIDIFDDKTGQAVLRRDTKATHTELRTPLRSGVTYQWSVTASDTDGREIAYYSAWYFQMP